MKTRERLTSLMTEKDFSLGLKLIRYRPVGSLDRTVVRRSGFLKISSRCMMVLILAAEEGRSVSSTSVESSLSKTMRVEPIRISSAFFSLVSDVIFWPFKKVPFLLPLSRTKYSSFLGVDHSMMARTKRIGNKDVVIRLTPERDFFTFQHIPEGVSLFWINIKCRHR